MKIKVVLFVTVVTALSLFSLACSQAAPPAPTTKAVPPSAPTTAPASVATAAPTAAKPAASPAPTAAPAKASFPEKGKSITFVVPWPAGGGTDLTARLLASGMEKELGVPVQIVNKPGASSQLGMGEVVKGKPDGYTVIITSIPSVLGPYLDPERKANFGRKDIQQVANAAWDPEAFAVKADSPYKSLKDVVDAAKANPGKLNMGTPGLQTDGHLTSLLFQQAAGVKLNIVHLEGSAGLSSALLGGHIDLSINSQSNYAGPMKNGDVRLLGIADKEESKYYPGVKTFESQGYKIHLASSRGVSVAAGTPKEIVDVLAGSIKKAMATDEFKKKMAEMYLVERYLGPAEYTTYWDEIESLVKPLIVPGS